MKKFILPFFILVFACSKKDDPNPAKYATLSIESGGGKAGVVGETLRDSIMIHVSSSVPHIKLDHFYLQVENIGGQVPVNQKGHASFKWTLGCDDTNQSIRVYLYYSDSCGYKKGIYRCQVVDSISATATASLATGWNRSCGVGGTDRFQTKLRSHGNDLYALNHGVLYKKVSQLGISWVPLKNVPSLQVNDFNFNSSGRMYITSQWDGIFYSDDLQTWTSINFGISDPGAPSAIMVEDSVVYASFSSGSLFRLRKGQTDWKKLPISGRLVTRHPNGDLYLCKDYDVWISTNWGDTWRQYWVDASYINLTISDMKINSAGLICVGADNATLTVLSPQPNGSSVHTYFSSQSFSSQDVSNIMFNGSDIFYLVNNTNNPGIYSSQGWTKVDSGFETQIFQHSIQGFCFDPSNGGLVIVSTDGFYFKN